MKDKRKEILMRNIMAKKVRLSLPLMNLSKFIQIQLLNITNFSV